MGWFDEQMRTRIAADDAMFAEAFADMASVVMGARVFAALENDRIKTKSAIEEILKYYHVKCANLPDGIDDVEAQLEYLLRPAGVMRRSVTLEPGWYKDAIGAMIGVRTDTGDAVALIPRGFSGYDFFDYSTGKRIKLSKKTEPLISREAICFYRPLPQKRLGFTGLLLYITQTLETSDYALIALVTAALTALGLITPRLNNIIYSTVISSGNVGLLIGIMTFLICVTLSSLLVDAARSLVMARITAKMNMATQAAGMMRLLSLPPEFFKHFSSGELSSRTQQLNSLCQMIVSAVLTTGLSAVFSLSYLSQMSAYAPGLVVTALVVMLANVAFSIVTTLIQSRITKKLMEANAEDEGLIYSLITGVQKIKLAGAEKRAFAKWAKSYKEAAKLQYDPPLILKLSGVVTTAISLAGTVAIYFFAIKTSVSLADYFSFNAAFGMVSGAFASLIGMAQVIANIKPVYHMIQPLLEAVPETNDDKHMVTRLSGGIELNNVSFRYTPDSPLILNDLSLKIKPHQYVAIVGRTGCGKSTLMRLMLGFETPQKGAVYYDGRDVSTLDLKSLRQHIGAVMQNGKLFSGDVYSNIVVCAPRLTLDEAWEAAETAGIADDIRAMPMGMSTYITEGSGGISGGQRQRLMIARAIAPKPSILMFDEATSALDNLTQRLISDSLDRLRCTRIVIAHRLSTIKHCDRIIVLDAGRIVEDGTYDELIGAGGTFSELVARQRLDSTEYIGKTTLF